MKKYLYPLVVFLFSCSFLSAQNKENFSLQARIGLVGDAHNQSPTYESFATTHDVDLGGSWAIGGNYQYLFAKHIGFRMGVLYEQGRFTQLEAYTYQAAQNTTRSGDISRRYTNRSILMPVHWLLHFKKAGLSTGIIPNYHLKTKLEQEHIFFLEGEDIERNQRSYTSGEFTDYGFGDWERVDLEKQLDFQWAVGIYFYVAPKIIIDLEYKDFIGQNLLVREIKNYDVVNTFKRTHDPFGRTVSLGASWLVH